MLISQKAFFSKGDESPERTTVKISKIDSPSDFLSHYILALKGKFPSLITFVI